MPLLSFNVEIIRGSTISKWKVFSAVRFEASVTRIVKSYDSVEEGVPDRLPLDDIEIPEGKEPLILAKA